MDSQDDATRQACTHVFKSSLLQYRYNLRKTHFEGKTISELAQTSPVDNISREDWRGNSELVRSEGKANSELSQTSPLENISDKDWRGLVKHWSDPKYQVHYIYVIRSHVEVLFMHVPHKSSFL